MAFSIKALIPVGIKRAIKKALGMKTAKPRAHKPAGGPLRPGQPKPGGSRKGKRRTPRVPG